MNCQEFEELSGAYVLEALSEDELIAADAHLAECANCTHNVQQLQSIVELLPLSVPAVEPPPQLKTQIFAHIQALQASSETPTRIEQTPLILRPRKRRWNVSLLAATLLLLLLLLGGMLTWNLSLRQQVSQFSTWVPAPVTYTIHGTGPTAAATGQAIYYSQQHITLLVVRGLPQLTGTQIYQGWLLQGKAVKSIGLFNVQDGVATLDFQGDLSGYDSAAVSLEKGPKASSPAPNGPVVALGQLD